MNKPVSWRHGLPVPCVDLQFELVIPADADLGAVDRFLADALQFAPADIADMRAQDLGRQAAASYVARLLWAQSALLRIGLLPCFVPGWLLSLHQHRDGEHGRVKWRAVVALPFIDEVPLVHVT